MCLLVLAWQVHPRYRLVVAANRDEFHERAAAPLAKWPAPYDILAGRDLRAQGTWLGVDRQRRFGVVTNFRERQRPRPNAPSRGSLIPQYLSAPGKPAEFLAALEAQALEPCRAVRTPVAARSVRALQRVSRHSLAEAASRAAPVRGLVERFRDSLRGGIVCNPRRPCHCLAAGGAA